MVDRYQARVLSQLLNAASVAEIASIAERNPVALTPEFGGLIGEVIGTALSQGDTELAAGAEQLARILQAMREMAASEAHSALFELLMRTPLKDVLVEMADQGEWGSWLILLRAHPELCTNPFLEFLERIETSVREEDLWVLHALSAFLAECRDSGVDAAVSRWRSPVQAGERAALPPEYKIAAISHIAGLVEGRGDAAEAEALGNLGVLLYHRQLGDRAENLRCSAQLLKAASEQARALGEIMMKAQYQQALVNVLLLLDPEQGAASALAMADEALEGWEKKDDPELWGLLMTSMGNCLMRLRRTDEAIECYQQSLTVFGRDDSPRRWAISTFDLGGAYVERGMRGGDSTDFELGLTCLEEAAKLRTREADEMRWAMTEDGLGWCYLMRRRPSTRRDDLRRAVSHFTAALEFYRPGRPERPHTKNGLGQTYFALYQESGNRADLMQANAALLEALEVPGVSERRQVYRTLAGIAIPLSYTDPAARGAALEYQTAAVALVSAEKDPNDWADEITMLAHLLVTRPGTSKGEDHVIAIQHLTKALAVASGVTRARVLLGLGTAYAGHPLGDTQANATRALEYYHQALSEITRDGDAELWYLLQVLIVTSMLESEREFDSDKEAKDRRCAEVLGRLEEALDVSREQQWSSLAANIRNLIGEAYLTYKRPSEAVIHLEAARDEFRKLGHVDHFARVQFSLARAYGVADRRRIRAAMTARRLYPLSSSPYEFGQASQLLGYAYLHQGEPERAGHAYHDAVRARKVALTGAQLPTDQAVVRGWFRANLAEQACLAFARAAEQEPGSRHRRHLLTLAVESLDGGRMSGFPEFEAVPLADPARHDPGLLREYESAIARVNASARADRASVTGTLTGPATVILDTDRWLANRQEAREGWAELDAVLTRIRDRTGFSPASKPLTSDELAGALAEREALAYLLSDDADDGTNRLLILLILRDGTVRMRWTPDTETSAARDFYELGTWLPNQGSFAQAGADSSFYVGKLRAALDAAFPAAARLLTGPLAGDLRQAKVNRIFLVPCGILGNVPLHACPVDAAGQIAFCDEFDVSYLPSGALLRSLRSRPAPQGVRRVVTIANPLPNPSPLRFAATQQAVIAAAARSSGIALVELAEYQATSPAVRAAVENATHVDFACHGWLDQKYLLDSGLQLGDTPMVLRDLLDTRLLDGVALVTLMSCQSAVAGGNPFNDEPISLATGFLMAGAHAVLGTLWLVDDLATALLAGRFYRYHLVDKLPMATALGRAQRWLRELTVADITAELGDLSSADPLHQMIRPFQHPYYWTSFVLTCS